MRMTPEFFEMIKTRLEPRLARQATNDRAPKKLALTIRYLATGESYTSLYPQTKVGDILDSGPSRRRRRRNFLVDAITQKQINIFFSNLVHMLRVPKGRSLF